MKDDSIIIRGAREHNLKNIDLELPRNKLIVITGLSGSGKSSLAFDTLYAEGQRRYVESLSSYARQFLGQMDKPDVDYIEGLSPAISIDQKTTSHNPRSTVGTVTEIHDYLRLLFARAGTPHCPKCGKVIRKQTVDQIVDRVLLLPEGTKLMILAPVIRGRKGEYLKLLEDLLKQGYTRARIDGEVCLLEEPPTMTKTKKHDIDVVIDRIIIRENITRRLSDSIETALRLGSGLTKVQIIDGDESLFSSNYACPDCGVSIEEMSPRMFSFNNPYGACPTCAGLGVIMKVDPAHIIPDMRKSLSEGAIQAMGWGGVGEDGMAYAYLSALAERYGFSLDTPVEALSEEVMNVLLYGTQGEKLRIRYQRGDSEGTFSAPFEGIVTSLERRYRETGSEGMKNVYESYMSNVSCACCKGRRLKPEPLAVTIGEKNIAEVSDLPIRDALAFFKALRLTEKEQLIADQILREIRTRLSFLNNVGLDYLSLSRSAGTLSGGEAQRIRLATQIGSGLVGVLYILDEPSIGLHQRDNQKLLDSLKGLRDLGNTLIVVEHDDETMREADWLVDIGPGAGVEGGRVVAEGTPEAVMHNPHSLTGQYLIGKRAVVVPETRRKPRSFLTIRGAQAHNLKNIDVAIPLGVITCVTGVSGSGKSSLVNEILYKSLAHTLNKAHSRAGKHVGIDGIEALDKVIAIDQAPIGRTPRSNPATYTGLFDLIREIFAATPDAKARGYKPNRFSFNVKGGRCEACSGDGILKIEMHFLSDVYVPCEVCKGKRYNRETLEVRYKGKSIYEVLELTVDEALVFFASIPRIAAKLQTMHDVGLGYVKLGQPSTTLSGGEAQRIKLATELSRRSTGRTLYILDEPTTGLHMNDVERLIDILQRLADTGNSLVIIEHNLDVIKCADYVIDLGPEGGDCGGHVIARGTPEEVSKCPESHTGIYLKKLLGGKA